MAASETLWGLLRAVLVGVLLSVLLIRLFEERLVYFPDVSEGGSWNPEEFGVRVEDVFLTTSDGIRLHAWWAPAYVPDSPGSSGQAAASPGARYTILLLHGNAGNLSHRIETIGFLQQLPANVLAVDYRGYGKSAGRPTEEGLYLDAQAAYDYLTRAPDSGTPDSGGRDIPPGQVVALGQSLGTAVAVDLATKRPLAALILESGFPSARRVAQRAIWLPGIAYVIRTKLDSASKLKGLHLPMLVAHCRGDSVIPYALGEELFAAANQPKTLVTYPGGCHEPLFIANPVDYGTKMRRFLGMEAEETKETKETKETGR